MMLDRKDDDEDDAKNWSAPLTFHFSRPANDNQSPLMKQVIAWGAVAIGLGSIVLLLVM